MTRCGPRRGRLTPGRAAPRGVTLIELVIAVAVLALGTAAAWRSLDAARRGIGGQAARALAEEVALNRAAELRLAGPGAELPERVTMGGRDWILAATPRATLGGLAETEIVVTPAGGRGGASARIRVWLLPEPGQGAQP